MNLLNVIETKRLILRQFTPADAADNYRIYTDPENMKFMGRQPDSVEFERDHIRKHITNYYEKYGFGLWAVVLKENNHLIGRCGFLYQQIEDARETEITYLIDKHFWGKGLATEAAREIVRFGFEKYKFPRIVAVINPKNLASIRVAEKIGMEYERNVNFKDFGKVAMYILEARDLARLFN
jgi:[ribosomal protein S5]-alanine N-acetyltransferase